MAVFVVIAISFEVERLIEMKRRGGSGDGTGMSGPDGLIILAIARVGRSLRGDVGWQGHGTDGTYGREQRLAGEREVEPYPALPGLPGDL